jgi:hypothetical protein
MTNKPLESYLAPKPRNGLGISLAMLALAVAAIWLALLDWKQLNKSRLLDEQLATLQVKRAARAVPIQSRQQIDEAKQWTQLRLEKDFPWQSVFQAIERTSSQDIELLEFHPDKSNRLIVLSGEARNIDGLLAYLQELSIKTTWTNVHLTHQEKIQHGTLETISFEIKAAL